jgi:uncharacterized membrane protein
LTPQHPSTGSGQGPSQPQITPVGGGSEVVREQDKPQLVLSYLSFLCIIPLVSVKDSAFVQWHAKQGLVLSLLGMASAALWSLWPLALLNCLLWPAMFVAAVMSVWKAFQGERWRIPVVADLSEKF